jgi:hypothetical protein
MCVVDSLVICWCGRLHDDMPPHSLFEPLRYNSDELANLIFC